MVEVVLKLPDDFNWILKNRQGLKWVETAIINKLTEMNLGDLLAEKSELKEEDIDVIDHIIKKNLYKRIKADA